MNKAPKLNQLLEVAETVNENWYPFIQGYLKGELENLELDCEDQYEPTLNLGSYDSCVVGEVYGFSGNYRHATGNSCISCARFAEKLYDNSGVYSPNDDFPIDEGDTDAVRTPELDEQRQIFAETLEDFYRHRRFIK